MKIDVTTLPSKGYNYLIRDFELNPLTYNQIVNYTKDSVEEPLMRVLHEIEYLLGDIPGYKDLSAYDLKAIIFARKYISATFKDTITVKLPSGLKVININNITYKSISKELMSLGSVNLGGWSFEFNIPTIGRYEVVLRLLATSYPKMSPEVAMVIASLGDTGSIDQVTQCVLNATGSDILVVRHLSKILNDTVNDVTIKDDTKGGDSVVSLNDSITDIFRLIELNTKFNENEVFITKVL